MSKAEELLNTLESSNVSLMALDGEEPHIVIGADRYITVPDQLKRIAVQYDHDIETVTFDCPRYWDDHDMSTMAIYINYLCPDRSSGVFPATNVKVSASDSSIMQFDWTISKNVTMAEGKLTFLVCIKNADSDGNEKNHWNSELCTDCYISKGLEINAGAYEDIVPDFIAQWAKEVTDLIDDTYQRTNRGDFDGATFTPMVNSTTGVISWTNNKGKTNPTPVNIKGPAGVSPTIAVTDIQGGHRVTITDADGSKSFDVMDTIIDSSEAVDEMMNRFVTIGGTSTQPSIGPALWFDTTKHEIKYSAELKIIDSDGNVTPIHPDSFDDGYQGESSDGQNYNVNIPGLSEFQFRTGLSFNLVPLAINTYENVTLNVNNTGNNPLVLRQGLGDNYSTLMQVGPRQIVPGVPFKVTLLNTATENVWIAELPSITYSLLESGLGMMYGGTGANNGDEGLKNLLAAGPTILSDNQYGNTLPSDGVEGQLFFKTQASTSDTHGVYIHNGTTWNKVV